MKKSFFLVPLGTILILITFILSCNKDIDLEKKSGDSPQNAFVQLDWTSQEKDFFSTTRTQSTSAIERSQYRTIFHTEVIAAYNQIAQENARYHFVDELATSAGLPLWIQSSIRKNTTTGETMVVIPMAKPNTNQISAFISLYKKQNEFDGKFVINGIGRGHLLDTLPGNIYNKKAFAGLTYKLEQKIFNSTDPLVSDAYCRLKRQISDGGFGGGPGGPGGPGLISPPTQNCEWRYIEICNDGNGSDWITGGAIPLHMDHDQDGIPNDNDEDWLDLVAKGLTQNQFNYYVNQYWEEYMFDDYGDYDTFYGNIDLNGGTDINLFIEGLGDIFDGFLDFLVDIIHDLTDFDDLLDLHGVDCPDMSPLTGGANDREINCDWFYAYVCDSDGVLWWDDIIETTPYEPDPNYQGTEQARFCEHWENNYSNFFTSCDEMYSVLGSHTNNWTTYNCDFYSPYYESCVDDFARDWFNEVIYEEQQQPTGQVPVGPGQRTMCANFFTFVTRPQTQTQTGGVKNLTIALTIDQLGNTANFVLPYVYFTVQNWSACPAASFITPAQMAATAINQAITNTNLRISLGTGEAPQGFLPKNATQADRDMAAAKATYLIEIARSFNALVATCNTNQTPLNSVSFPSILQVEEIEINFGTNFVNYNRFTQFCP